MASLKVRLRELRREHKLKQKDVADFLGITESAYGFYEQGRNEPSLENLRKLAKKYNVSVGYLIGDTDTPEQLSILLDEDFDLNPEHKDKTPTELLGQKPESFYSLSLSEDELQLLNELKKHPILFHDLASDPEKKIKELIKLRKMKKLFLEEDDEEYGDGFGDLED